MLSIISTKLYNIKPNSFSKFNNTFRLGSSHSISRIRQQELNFGKQIRFNSTKTTTPSKMADNKQQTLAEFLKTNQARVDKVKDSMLLNRFGRTGIRVSRLSFGTWVNYSSGMTEETATGLIDLSLKAGINLFDTAEIYAAGQAEIMLGKALKTLNVKRSDVVISTKLIKGGPGPNDWGLSRKHLTEGLTASLQRLQMDYVDILFAHRPDPDVEMEEIVRTFTNFINQGKVFYWATSEWSAQQIQEAHAVARQYNLIPPSAEQPQYHLLERKRVEGEYQFLYEKGLALTTWSTLAGGLLTGKYLEEVPAGSRFATDQFKESRNALFNTPEGKVKLEKVKKLKEIADRLQVPLAQLALAWALKNPHVSTILLGASNFSQLLENLECLYVVEKLTDKILLEIEEIVSNKPLATEWGAMAAFLKPAKK